MGDPPSTEVVALHPAVLARYEQQLVELQDALSKGIRAGDSEAADAIRELIDTVTVYRDSSRPGGVAVEISGRLNALLGERAYPNKVRGVWGKVVAEEGYQQCHHVGFPRKWRTCSMWPEILTLIHRYDARANALRKSGEVDRVHRSSSLTVAVEQTMNMSQPFRCAEAKMT